MELEHYLNMARNQLTEEDFQKAQAMGRTLSLDQAVDYARQLRTHIKTVLQNEEKLDDLTARESEVAELIVQGKTNREIAEELVLSKRTVEKHVANILSKLELTNRSQIVRWELEKGRSQVPE